MQVKVVGFEKVDYFSKKQNRQVQGISLYCTRKGNKESITGDVAEACWLPLQLVQSVGFIPQPGSDVELIYDYDGRYSSLASYKLLDASNNSAGEGG